MKIVITGPECIGKTTLSTALAKYYDTHVVSEYARVYLANKLDTPYTKDDLLSIAKGTVTKQKLVERRDLVICDTGMLVMYIWGKVKFGSAHPEISQMLDDDTVDLYILPHWDIPFVEDPLRESNGDREVLHRLYKKELEKRSLPFTEVKGDEDMRLKLASQSIDVLWKYHEIPTNT